MSISLRWGVNSCSREVFDFDEGRLSRLSDGGVVAACRSGVCLTPYGVALVGLRTDAVGGAAVGAMAAGAVAEEVVVYSQIKSSLVEWAELLNREAWLGLGWGLSRGETRRLPAEVACVGEGVDERRRKRDRREGLGGLLGVTPYELQIAGHYLLLLYLR